MGAREHASHVSLGIAYGGGIETLVTTAEHPFYVRGRGFIRADSVSAGMQLVTATGESLDVVAARTRASAFLAYDISVDQFHTYFVGERGVWVHNCPVTKGTIQHTKHSLNQKINRQVKSTDELDAVKNPLKKTNVKYDSQGRPSEKFIGEKATVAINPETGKVVTVHPTGSKLAERLKRQQGGGQ